jgi:hypothetical protein
MTSIAALDIETGQAFAADHGRRRTVVGTGTERTAGPVYALLTVEGWYPDGMWTPDSASVATRVLWDQETWTLHEDVRLTPLA